MSAYCQAAGSDRNARAQCGADLQQAADACLTEGIAKGQGDDKILACYAAKGKKIAAIWMSNAVDPGQAPKAGAIKPGNGRIKIMPGAGVAETTLGEQAEEPGAGGAEQAVEPDVIQKPRLSLRKALPETDVQPDRIARDANGRPLRRVQAAEEPAAEEGAAQDDAGLSNGRRILRDANGRPVRRFQAAEEPAAEEAAAEEPAAEEPAAQDDAGALTGRRILLKRNRPIIVLPQQ